MVGNTIADVVVKARLDTKSAVRDANTNFASMGKRSGLMFSDSFKASIASGVALAFKSIAVAGGAAALGIGKSVKMAVDFNETLSKSNTIFKQNGAAITAWSKTTAKGMGISQAAALESAATFGNMFDQMGIGIDKTTTMSKSMVSLASDFASFHNADPTEVITAMTAAFRGEYDALQRYVPMINAAAVEQEAAAMTGKKVKDGFTAQEKALATYQLMMTGAGAAMGDFSRTQGSASNQIKILKAQVSDAATSMGNAFIPILTKVVTTLNSKAIPAVKGLYALFAKGDVTGGLLKAFGVEEDSKFVDVLLNMREAAIGAGNAIKSAFKWLVDNKDWTVPIAAGLAAMATALAVWNVAVGVATALQTAWNVVMAANPIGLVVLAIVGLVAALVVAYKQSETFRKIVDGLWTSIKNLASAIWNGLVAVFNFLLPLLQVLATAFMTWWNVIYTVISTVIKAIYLYVVTYISVLKAVWDAIWGSIGGTVMSIVDLIWKVLSNGAKAWYRVMSAVVGAVLGVVSAWWSGMKAIIMPAIDFITGLFAKWKDRIVSVFGGVKDALASVFRGIPPVLLKPLNAIIWMINGLIKLINKIPGVNIDPLGDVQLPGFATGGQIRGAGTGTSDSILARLSNGEFVLRAKAVKALSKAYGPNFLQRMNTFDAVGGDPSGAAILRPAFKDGGDVSGALDLLKKHNGNPYVFGGTPPMTDCSGWVGMAWAKALGKNPYQRYFTTASVLGNGSWSPGTVPNGFNINLINGGPGGGHISGELQGHRFESGGGHGYSAFDGPSARMGDFGAQYHSNDITGSKKSLVGQVIDKFASTLMDKLPTMPGMFGEIPKGIMDTVIAGLKNYDFDLFDQGGVLRDGALGINRSGKPEAVLTNDEYAMFKRLVNGGGQAQIVQNFNGGTPAFEERQEMKRMARSISRALA